MQLFGDNTGQNPILNVTRVTNGWVVVVHHHNRDKEISPETQTKRDAAAVQQAVDQKEREKKRIVREMTLQLANMAIIGEAAGKAQYKGVQDELEPWKRTDDEDEDEVEDSDDGETPKGALQKIEAIAQKIADESPTSGGLLGDFVGLCGLRPGIETHIFTEKEKMTEFVAQMLQPIIE